MLPINIIYSHSPTYSPSAFIDDINNLTFSGPKDFANPKNSFQKVYPEWGRRLFFSMIGEKVLRVYPCQIGLEYHWSFIPASLHMADIDASCLTLIRFLNGIPIFILPDWQEGPLPSEYNDTNWITLKDFLKFREDIAKETAPKNNVNSQDPTHKIISSDQLKGRLITAEDKGKKFLRLTPLLYDPHRPKSTLKHYKGKLKGEKLTDKFINKFVVRIYPFKKRFKYKWDYVPQEEKIEAVLGSAVLVKKHANGNYFLERDCDSAKPFDDNHWMDVDEFIQKREISYPNQPVEGHHPENPGQKVFPYWGEKLSEKHIGQRVVRVYPYLAEGKAWHGKSPTREFIWKQIPSDTKSWSIYVASIKICDPKELADYYNDNNWIIATDLIKKLNLPIKNAPVDGALEGSPMCKIYPEIGMTLGEEHIGKDFIRASPLKGKYSYQWSYFPIPAFGEDYNLKKQLKACYKVKLIRIEKDGDLQVSLYGHSFKLSKKWNDGLWTTKEAFYERGMKVEGVLNQPVNSASPLNPKQKVAGMLGDSYDDCSGHAYVRCYPYKEDISQTFKWDFIPEELTYKAVKKAAAEVKQSFQVTKADSTKNFDYWWYDTHWTTIEKFCKHFGIEKPHPLKKAIKSWFKVIKEFCTTKLFSKSYQFKPVFDAPKAPQAPKTTYEPKKANIDSKDPYEILGLPKDETDEKVIERAYKKLSLKYHPDKNPNDPNAEENFKKLGNAFDKLKNPNKNRAFICDKNNSQESDLKEINTYLRHLKSLHTHDPAQQSVLASKWHTLYQEIVKSLAKEKIDKLINLHSKRKKKIAKCNFGYYETIVRINNLHNAFPNMLMEEAEALILRNLESIKECMSTWCDVKWLTFENEDKCIHAFWMLQDSYAAFTRQLVEMKVSQKQINNAHELTQGLKDWIIETRKGFENELTRALMDHRNFKQKLSELTPVRPTTTKQEESEETEEDESEAPGQPEKAKESSPHTEKTEESEKVNEPVETKNEYLPLPQPEYIPEPELQLDLVQSLSITPEAKNEDVKAEELPTIDKANIDKAKDESVEEPKIESVEANIKANLKALNIEAAWQNITVCRY